MPLEAALRISDRPARFAGGMIFRNKKDLPTMNEQQQPDDESLTMIVAFLLNEVAQRFVQAAGVLGVEVEGVQYQTILQDNSELEMIFRKGDRRFGVNLTRTVNEILLKDKDHPEWGLDGCLQHFDYVMSKLERVVRSRMLFLRAFAECAEEQDLNQRIAELAGEVAEVRVGSIDQGRLNVKRVWRNGVLVEADFTKD